MKQAHRIVGLLTLLLLFGLALFPYVAWIFRAVDASEKSTQQVCPKLLFAYPLLVTDEVGRYHAEWGKFPSHGQEGVLVIPRYHEGTPYDGTRRKLNGRVTLGTPFIIVPDVQRSFGELVREKSPEALNADSFLFFVRGFAPVCASAYFTARSVRNPETQQAVQLLGVHRLSSEQNHYLNRIIMRELFENASLYISDTKRVTSFTEAMNKGGFFCFSDVGWPPECVETLKRNIGETGAPSSGEYTLRAMVSWQVHVPYSTISIPFTVKDKNLIREYLESAEKVGQ